MRLPKLTKAEKWFLAIMFFLTCGSAGSNSTIADQHPVKVERR